MRVIDGAYVRGGFLVDVNCGKAPARAPIRVDSLRDAARGAPAVVVRIVNVSAFLAERERQNATEVCFAQLNIPIQKANTSASSGTDT